MFGFGKWKDYARALESQLTDAGREIRNLEKREKLNLKERDEARGNVGRNDLLVVGNSPGEVRVYLNGAYVPQARAVEAAQHPGELRNVTLHLSAICRFVDTMGEAS